MKLPMRIQILPFLCYFLPSLLFSQYYQESGYTAISSQKKQVTDYFDNVDDKSFYQSQRIHGMKNEINSYSERLHKLQSRFDEIFYGLSRGGSFKNLLIPTRRLPVLQNQTCMCLHLRQVHKRIQTFILPGH